MQSLSAERSPAGGLLSSFAKWAARRAAGPALAASLLTVGAAALPAYAEAIPADQLVSVVAENSRTFTKTFNPFSPTSRWVTNRTMYEPLMIQNFATGKLEPWLATDYKWSADALELDVTLRDGVKWSDGQPLTAADVAFTFNLMKANDGLIGPASGAFKDYLKSVAADGDKTVKFTFSKVYTPGLYSIVGQFIVPEHVWKDVKDPVTFANDAPVASGPFTTIANFGPQQYQVTNNPNYWQPIAIKGINVQAFSGNDQISAAVLSGQIDWGGLVPDPDTTFVARDPAHFGYWWPRSSVVQFVVNTTDPALGDVKVRKAMSLALDRQRMINTAVWGKSVPANATGLAVTPFKDWIDQKVVDAGSSWIGDDPDAAKKMLDDAGYKAGSDGIRVGKDGKPLSYSIIVPNGWNDWISDCQVISENLKDIGINVDVKVTTVENWTNSTFNGSFQMALGSAQPTATPFEFYRNNMGSATVVPVGQSSANNVQRFADKAADPLLDKFAASTDLAEQKTIASQLETMFSADAPVIPLYEQPDWGLYNTMRFTGFPTEKDPYAPLSLQMANTPLLVFPHLKPVAK